MRRYLDTSVVVSFFIKEVHTSAVRDWLAGTSGDQNIISEWTATEFQSALSLKLRTQQITLNVKAEAEHLFEQACGQLFALTKVDSLDFDRASRFAARSDLWLRAGDALNLAIAERRSEVLYTVDKRLLAASLLIGFPAQAPAGS